MAKDGRARLQPCRNPPRRGERSLAGGERSEPPDRIRITIRTPAGVAGAPRAPAGARWSRRHGFQGFAKSAHPWLIPATPPERSHDRSGGLTGRYEAHSLYLDGARDDT